MILNLSDYDFNKLVQNTRLHLPIRWDGKDFEKFLFEVFEIYINELKDRCKDKGCLYPYFPVELDEIILICDRIREAVSAYHRGYPAWALVMLSHAMELLIKYPLKVYQKKSWNKSLEIKNLHLYRMRGVRESVYYTRKDIFHVPVSARSMIATCRYSIAGYPSLYLSTSLNLCAEEIGGNSKQHIVSRFEIISPLKELNIKILELGIKPQDFNAEENEQDYNYQRIRYIRNLDLSVLDFRKIYLKWYPLIAACSFIRVNKSAPFASEYIIPQLLMQWVRIQNDEEKLMGIRYFSCSSAKASEMGFDYVFPVSDFNYDDHYCSVLRNSFILTEPIFLEDYGSINLCENKLNHMDKLDRI